MQISLIWDCIAQTGVSENLEDIIFCQDVCSFKQSLFQDLESFMNQHTTENRALIEELKQDLIVNSILEEQVKQQSTEYAERLEKLELQVNS